jgi:uroporphyrinogen III methyltransferase/synthase
MVGRLEGRRVVVTRAGEQVGRLRALLTAEGAEVIEVPTIAVVDPAGGDEVLRSAMRDVWDWVVVTSPNGAERAVAAAGGRAAAHAVRWAVVGPGTAETLGARGVRAALVPERFVAEGLLEVFPRPPVDGGGRVLVAQAEAARPVLVDGLRAAGWDVTAVVAYRTVPVTPPTEQVAAAASADAVLFTSGSTVDAFVRAAGKDAVPRVVVVIGPVTGEAARRHGLVVAAEASPHTLEGLVAAATEALA